MNPNLILALLQLVISLAASQHAGKDVAQILLDIIRKAIQAYEEQTGETLDPTLIRAENAL